MTSTASDRFAALTIRDEHRLRHKRRVDEAELVAAEARIAARRAAVPEITYPEQLPVTARRDDIAAAIAAHQVVVIAGETGSGKTTQIPKICLELGRGVRGTIGHTQPRRLAARTVAERLGRIHEGRVTRIAGAAVAAVASGATLTGFAVPFDDFTGDASAPTAPSTQRSGQRWKVSMCEGRTRTSPSSGTSGASSDSGASPHQSPGAAASPNRAIDTQNRTSPK